MSAEDVYRASLRTLLEKEVYPYVAAWEQAGFFPREIICLLGASGAFASCFWATQQTDKQRRLLLRMSIFRILIEELAKTLCFGLTLTISMHVGIFLPLLIGLVHSSLKETLVEKSLRGDILGTIAATEPAIAGSDFMSMQCSATFAQDKILLEGMKHYITNAAVADYVIVFARWRPGRHFTNFCALLLPTRASGVHSSVIDMAVMRTAVISHLECHQVELPISQM